MISKISSAIKKHPIFFIFIFLYLAIFSFKLISNPTPFYDWDESLYIQSGKEMIEHKFFLFPVWQGQPWLDKPPMVPLIYATVAKVFFFIAPEISTRLFTLFISSIVLFFVYKLYFYLIKEQVLTTVVVFITAFTPIFLQRSQVVNLDIFLLLGWLGYLLFYERFWVSLLFLMIAIFSKSLIGFYPTAMMMGYFIFLFVRHKIDKKELITNLKKIMTHILIGLSWFAAMLVVYGLRFWKLHIIESHFRRVTASIEFHFGQRTFYIDLARDQLGILFWIGIIGLFVVLIKYFKKEKELFASLFLLPWFLFLNLTKTKIFWYFYASIPQFGFLAAAPLLAARKNKYLYWGGALVLIFFTVQTFFIKQNVLATQYSKPESYYHLALYAKDKCNKLVVYMDKQTRSSFAELDRQGLLITTTKWWGSHPSVLYYYGGKIDFIYDRPTLISSVSNLKPGQCLSLPQDSLTDVSTSGLTQLNSFPPDHLFIK